MYILFLFCVLLQSPEKRGRGRWSFLNWRVNQIIIIIIIDPCWIYNHSLKAHNVPQSDVTTLIVSSRHRQMESVLSNWRWSATVKSSPSSPTSSSKASSHQEKKVHLRLPISRSLIGFVGSVWRRWRTKSIHVSDSAVSPNVLDDFCQPQTGTTNNIISSTSCLSTPDCL